ncbi:unnamed protein product [Orchesella dallaii]|uniref:Secreted protein n=1 Tax=Orchesella dallaii TaxID=48710 RepID=A0ABP1S7A9_9HEXA
MLAICTRLFYDRGPLLFGLADSYFCNCFGVGKACTPFTCAGVSLNSSRLGGSRSFTAILCGVCYRCDAEQLSSYCYDLKTGGWQRAFFDKVKVRLRLRVEVS